MDATVRAFADVMKGVVTTGVGSYLPYPSSATPAGIVMDVFLLHLQFACGVVGDGDMSSIWEDVARPKGRKEGNSTLNKALMQGLP